MTDGKIYAIDELRALISPIAAQYGVDRIFLFGSYARGTATEGSDIDLIIDTSGTEIKSLLHLAVIHDELETVFGKSIDLITQHSLEQRPQIPSELSFRSRVKDEKVMLYIST